ncbi:hypothetical protein MBLNU459_g5101t2 [Dothideomycetes sp. NU459]
MGNDFPTSEETTVSELEAAVHSNALAQMGRLPRQDGGKGAWLFLFGACIIEVTAWGFPYCFGVFRSYFYDNPPFERESIVSVGGVLSNGVLQISLPFVIYYVNNFPRQRKTIMWLGCVLCTSSAIGAGFAKTAIQLVICIGLLYGIGAGMLFGPSIHLMSEWFRARKSLAYGAICAAGAAAGAGLPPVYTVCLGRYGYKVTLVGWGIVTFIVTSIGLFCVQPRVPVTVVPKPSKKDFDFLQKPLFYVILVATVVQALAHYGPSLYLPSFGNDFGLTPTQGSLLVSLLNLAQAIGQPLQGMLADHRQSFYIPMLISTIGASLEVFLIWGFARNLWSLVLFSLAFGSTAGGFAVLRPRFAAAIVGDEGEQDQQSLLIFAILTASRGTAIVGSGFIMTDLVGVGSSTAGYGGGSEWRNLVIYTGVVMLAASLGAVGFFVSPHAVFGAGMQTTARCTESDNDEKLAQRSFQGT